MANQGRRSMGSLGSNDISSADPEPKSMDDEKEKTVTISRILTVVAYMISVSTAAALLSAYYIFLWVPQPSDPLVRPTDSPFSLAQHGNSHMTGGGGSYYHYPKNSYTNSQDSKHTGHATSAARGGSKKGYHHKTTVPPNHLPKPQYLRKKGTTTKPTATEPPRYRY